MSGGTTTIDIATNDKFNVWMHYTHLKGYFMKVFLWKKDTVKYIFLVKPSDVCHFVKCYLSFTQKRLTVFQLQVWNYMKTVTPGASRQFWGVSLESIMRNKSKQCFKFTGV